MKRIVKIGFRHADSVPFRALSHPAPQYARRLYAPAKLPLWESNLSIHERHSCAPAIPERQPRERARRRRVVLAFRVDKPIPTNIAGSRASAVYACSTRTANAQRAEDVSPLSSFSARTSPPTQSLPEVAYLPYAPATPERQTRECARRRRNEGSVRRMKRIVKIGFRHADSVPFRALSHPAPQYARRLYAPAKLPLWESNLSIHERHSCAPAIPERQPRERARRRRVVLAFRVDKPVPTSIAGSHSSAVCARDTRTANARTRGSRQRDEGSVRRMKRTVKIGFRHADSVPFRAPSHPAPQYARGLRAPAKRPLWESNLSIRERHSCAPAIPERQPRERARRRRVVLAFRVDKPIPTNIAGSRASAVYACSTRTANAQRAEAVSPLSSFSARTSPPTQSLPEVTRLSYAYAIPERQPRECARRRHVVLAFRVDKPVPTNITGSRASAICARGNRPANAQRAEAVSTLSSFSARTRPPTQSLPEVAYLPYAPATPERQPRERAGAVSGTKGACAG